MMGSVQKASASGEVAAINRNVSRRRIPFTVVGKPAGAACNLDCTYCFFLSKELLYEGDRQRMTVEALRSFIRSYLDAQPDGPVTLVWQGGEPTMRGLDFFRQAVQMARECARPTQQVSHSLQTNGVLLDDRWGEFLAEEKVLVGLSMDGPAPAHDTYRVDRRGVGSHAQVHAAWDLLRRHRVDTNILCTVHAANQHRPLDIYRYFRDELGAEYLQFIPVVERVSAENLERAETGWSTGEGTRLLYRQHGDAVTSRSVDPQAWGQFLIEVFDEWRAHDVGRVFVQTFDAALSALFGQFPVCTQAPRCGTALAMEFNGDVYSCDHFVEPEYRLGNVVTGDRFEAMLASPAQKRFGAAKADLPGQCRRCPVLRFCYGGCPKDRFAADAAGEPGLNYLCAGWYAAFSHMAPDLGTMARLVRMGRPASDVMERPPNSSG